MKFNKFFKKKKKEPVKVSEPKKSSSYLDFFQSDEWLHKKEMTPAQQAERFKFLFPRTIESIKPIILGKNGKRVAVDSDISFGRTFTNEIPTQVMGFLNQTFIGWQACALLKQNPFIDRACSIPAKDAIAPDYKLAYIDQKDAEKDKETPDVDELGVIKEESRRLFNINEICVKHEINKKTYGYSLVVPLVDDVDMSMPYNIDGVKTGSYHGMAVVEPYWITPELDSDSASNPAHPHFYEPTYYKIGNKRIHWTWCIRAVNSQVSDTLKPTYYFGGVPLTQQIYERVYAAEKVANEAPMLAMTKRLLVVDANVENAVANPREVEKVMNALTYLRDNYGVYAKHTGDQVQQIDTSLADFDALIMSQYQLVASIAGMPATKLLKTTPKGFNSTGEYEQEDYKQSLLEIQENYFIPVIARHNELYTKSKFGRVIKLDIKFNPIDQPTEKELADIANTRAEVAMTHITAGITTASEEREILRNEDGSPYSGLPEEMEEPEIGNIFVDNQDDTDEDADNQPKGGLPKQPAEDEKWITINPNGEEEKGKHLLLNDGETPKDAMKRQWGVELKDKRKPESETKEPETAQQPVKEEDKTGTISDEVRQARTRQIIESEKAKEERSQKRLEKSRAGIENGGYELVRETKKAVLVKKDDKTVWLPRSTVRADGTLTDRGKNIFESERTDSEKKAYKEEAKKRRENGIEIPKPAWESDKAYGFDVISLIDPNTEYAKRFRVFVPKSVVQENGNLPYWILEKKMSDIPGQIEWSPFEKGPLAVYDREYYDDIDALGIDMDKIILGSELYKKYTKAKEKLKEMKGMDEMPDNNAGPVYTFHNGELVELKDDEDFDKYVEEEATND